MNVVWVLVCLVLFPGSLAAQKIKLDYDRSTDFSKYKTFAWIPEDSLPILRAGPQMDGPGDQEIDEMIRAAVEKRLGDKKLQKQDKESADLLLTYVAVGRLKLESAEVNPGAGAWPGANYGHWRPFAEGVADSYMTREGTLTLDLVDAKTNQLVWRGSSSDTVKKGKEIKKKIDKSVKKLLKKFPPR